MNGRAVYCAVVRRWTSAARQEVTSLCGVSPILHRSIRWHPLPFANPALRLNRRKISSGRNPGYRATPDETFWRAGGTPETHLVPPFCGGRASAVATKHFLSASVAARPLLVMNPYLSTAFVEGDVTGKNTCLYGLIKRGSGRIHPFEPERCLSFAKPG